MTDESDPRRRPISRRRFVAGTLVTGAAVALPAAADAHGGGNGPGGTNLQVTNEILWSTDPRVGLDPNNPGDQTDRLQSFANLLTQSAGQADRVGYLVPGTYKKSKPITLRNNSGARPFKLLGRGSKVAQDAPSVIIDTVDAGPGSYSVDVASAAGAFHIEGVSLVGSLNPAAKGSAGWQMRAIRIPTYCTVSDFGATGYFAGITLMGDHVLVEDFVVQGNAYGIDFGPNAVTQGDIALKRGRAGGASIAAIGVARSGTMAGVRFEDVEASTSPYCIKRYDDGTGKSVPNWINGVDFVNIATEYTGNAIVFNDVDPAGITSVSFDHGSASNWGLYSAYADPKGSQVAAWYNLGSISDVTFPKSLPTYTKTQPAIYAPAIVRVLCHDGTAIPSAVAAGSYPFKLMGDQNGNHLVGTACGDNRGYRTLVVPYKAETALKQGCCVVPGSLYDVTQYSGSGRVLGIAGHDAGSKTVIHAILNGIEIPVLNTSTRKIDANALLVPDSNGGVAAGSYSTGQVIGRALEAIPAGRLGSAELHI